jgi:FAD/FMN-containing dehydrogenase
MKRVRLSSWTGLPHARTYSALDIEYCTDNPFEQTEATLLARGNGRSYGDVCLPCNTAAFTARLRRIYSFDTERGIITAEAGISLGELLRITIPRGWTLPVLPGTGAVTVGGAIANDIHGKSHHWAGTFGRWVRQIELLRSDGRIRCSLSDNAELLAATIGGLGLTGIIIRAELQLVPCNSAWMETRTMRFSTLEEFYAHTHTLEATAEYVVAWCDLSRRGNVSGIISAASFCNDGERSVHPAAHERRFPPLPVSVFFRPTVRIANMLYRWLSSRGPSREHYTTVFFPLDRLPWNRLFGPRGFYQLQAVFPDECARDGVTAICERLWHAELPVPLCVLKKFSAMESPGLLSFPMAGTSIALDVPNTNVARDTLKAIIADVVAAGGRIYPAKDVLMTPAEFHRMYPQWGMLEHWRDRRCCSQFWERVTCRSL